MAHDRFARGAHRVLRAFVGGNRFRDDLVDDTETGQVTRGNTHRFCCFRRAAGVLPEDGGACFR